MTEINPNIIAFSLAKQVYNDELSQTDAARLIHDEHGVNINSAKIMFAVYKGLVNGVEFKRALSAPDMNYFLAQILAENGAESLHKPINALWKHILYYENKNDCNLNALRKVAIQYEALSQGTQTLEGMVANIQEAVEKSAKDSHEVRKKRLEVANKKPNQQIVSVTTYTRNPDVIAEVLFRANGVCEHCKSNAPFKRRKDNTPFLEVHHKIRLADGGEDTIENAIAICPNCHRNLHYGNAEA